MNTLCCNQRWTVLLLALCVVLGSTAASHAQDPFGRSLYKDDTRSYKGSGKDSSTAASAVPYRGQIYCPVTGIKLGLNGPAQEVQTSLGEQQPTGMRKLMGAKPTPGVAMFVCCPECAKKVKANPSAYLLEVVADKAVFTISYDSAPNQRPERPK